MINAGFAPRSFDGIVVDTSYKICQLKNDIMCISQKELNKLDLRNQSVDATLVQPTASDLLQHIGDKELNKMLKVYANLANGLNSSPK